MQHLDMSGRPGLLRTVLEAQETRGLTRSDDISRLLPAGVHAFRVLGCSMQNSHRAEGVVNSRLPGPCS